MLPREHMRGKKPEATSPVLRGPGRGTSARPTFNNKPALHSENEPWWGRAMHFAPSLADKREDSRMEKGSETG